jgi:hypothetical protein
MCKYCGTDNYKGIYKKHHGPIPIDQDGRSFDIHHKDGNHKNNDPNNLIALSIVDHYNAHFLNENWNACILIALRMKKRPHTISELMKKCHSGMMTVKVEKTGKLKRIKIDDPIRYTGEVVSVIKDKTIIREISSGETFWVNINDARFQSGEIVGLCKGKTAAIEIKSGNIIQVQTDDPRWKTGEIVGNRKSYTLGFDIKTNKCISIHKEDYRLKSNEVIPIRKGKCKAVLVSTGETIESTPFDERWKTGEIVGLTNGLVSLRNIETGEIKLVKVEDKKKFGGKWVSANKGYPQKKKTCVWCGKTGGGGNIRRYHNDNCKLNPNYKYP